MITMFIGPNGRFGNQMFQYAALVGIASKQGLSYGLDYHYADSLSWKEFSVDNAYDRMVIDKPFDIRSKAMSWESRSNPSSPRPMQEQPNEFHFQKRFFSCGDNVYLHGFFQSLKYFEHCQDVIREAFTFRPEIVEEAQKFLAPKKNHETVAIHIRRGDYLKSPWHGICENSYYDRALGMHFCDKAYNFIVITDDIPWARANITNTNHYTISDSGNQFVDMCIMSLCDHAIIANSSFSWWGSWLNTNPNKKVIAPSVWFREHLAALNTKDLYLPTWKIV